MTIDKKEVIKIPVWLAVLLIPAIMGSAGWFIVSGKYRNQVEINTGRLDKVEANKVNQTEFLIIQTQLNRIEDNNKQQLNRIENKLDTHIEKGATFKLFK